MNTDRQIQKKEFPLSVCAYLNVDAFLGLLAVEQAFDIEVGAPRVLVHRRAHSLSLTGDDDVRVRGWEGEGRKDGGQLSISVSAWEV